MPRFTADSLRTVGNELFQAAGCSEDDARTIAEHLVESNLFGHDSHGTIRMYEYVQAIREGRFHPKAQPKIVEEAPCSAVVDAGGAMGPVGATLPRASPSRRPGRTGSPRWHCAIQVTLVAWAPIR